MTRAGNIELAHRVIDAVEERDLATLIELSDPAVEWQSAFVVSGTGGAYVGHEGLREYVDDMNDAWEVVRLDVDEEIGVGEVVVFVGHIEVKGKGSGAENQSVAGYMLKFDDGRLVRFRPFREPEAALEAIGL